MDNDNIIKRIHDIGILPVIDLADPDNIYRACMGEKIGTLVIDKD